jgi:hypothetical protein
MYPLYLLKIYESMVPIIDSSLYIPVPLSASILHINLLFIFYLSHLEAGTTQTVVTKLQAA